MMGSAACHQRRLLRRTMMTVTIPVWVLWVVGVPAAIVVAVGVGACIAVGFAVLREL